jgi:hypothetical protein
MEAMGMPVLLVDDQGNGGPQLQLVLGCRESLSHRRGRSELRQLWLELDRLWQRVRLRQGRDGRHAVLFGRGWQTGLCPDGQRQRKR